MKLIVGLGNPGNQYTKTRHNAGFLVVDRLVAKHAPGETPRARFNAAAVECQVGGERCLLLKPTTFMNRSGMCVGEAVGFYKLSTENDLLVITDDIYLPLGALRMRPAGGTGGHNGLSDIQRALGREDYPRLRLGVGVGETGGKPEFMDQADFVLSRLSDDEWATFSGAIDKSVKACETFVSKGIDAAMNSCNAPETPARPKRERPSETKPENKAENKPESGPGRAPSRAPDARGSSSNSPTEAPKGGIDPAARRSES